MTWTPKTSAHARNSRATMLRDIRQFFYDRNVLEVETPALSKNANTDPFIESFILDSFDSSRFLHTSPEYPMKRLLAAGSGDIYQICKVWRKEESGSRHNPEFSLLEYYRVGFSYQDLMREVDTLLSGTINHLTKESQFVTYAQLFLEKFSLNPHIVCYEQLLKHVSTEIPSLNTEGLDQQALLDALLTHCIEPEFAKDQLTFVYDYPASQSALSQLRKVDNYFVAERFEVYLGNLELGNGYQEEVDSKRNHSILDEENKARSQMGLKTMPIDKYFLEACDSGIPASAGIAIGLDRVLMAITGENSIQKVINFAWDKA